MRYGYGYRRSRDLGFPNVRAFGWVIALPVAFFVGLIVAIASGSKPWGVGVGAGVALLGIAIVSFGYMLADAFGGYFPRLALLSAAPIGALVWAVSSGYAWLWAIGWAVVIVVLIGISRGIMIHANSRHTWLVADILRGFTPRG